VAAVQGPRGYLGLDVGVEPSAHPDVGDDRGWDVGQPWQVAEPLEALEQRQQRQRRCGPLGGRRRRPSKLGP
jgi:hypothetical protein